MKRTTVHGFGWIVAGSAAASLLIATCWAAQDGAASDRTARAAARTAAKEKANDRREAAKERREAAKEKAEAAKEARESSKAEAKANLEAAREKKSDVAADRVDARQANQARRIQQGITKGYLTNDEIAKLNAQQSKIAQMESSLKSDGRLSRDESNRLRAELNEASRCIWAEKHDTEGNQMPTYRLGKNVFAKDNLTAKLADENLSAADAKALLKDFHRTVELKHKLAADDLSDTERTALQSEYDTLLNTYFEVR